MRVDTLDNGLLRVVLSVPGGDDPNDTDALPRAIRDGLQGRDGWLILGNGRWHAVAPLNLPYSCLLGGQSFKAWLQCVGGDGPFLRAGRVIDLLSVDDGGRATGNECVEAMTGNQVLKRMHVRNSYGFPFALSGDNVRLRNFSIEGIRGDNQRVGPGGGTTCGVWVGQGSSRIQLVNGWIHDCCGGAIFLDGTDFWIESIRAEACQLGYTLVEETGAIYKGGFIDVSGNAHRGTIKACEINGAGTNGPACGLEVSAGECQVLGNHVWDFVDGIAMILQDNANQIVGGDGADANWVQTSRVGLKVNPWVTGYQIKTNWIEDSCSIPIETG